MKKLIVLLMVASLVFAGGWNNIFNGTAATSATVNSTFRYPAWDETNENRMYVTQAVLDAVYFETETIDTNTVVADASAATLSVSAKAGEVIRFLGLYPGGTWDAGDYIEINTADSNATTIDTLHLGVANGWHTGGGFDFYCTQDTTLYINLGDTVSVASTVSAKLKIQHIK